MRPGRSLSYRHGRRKGSWPSPNHAVPSGVPGSTLDRLSFVLEHYRGTSLTRKRTPLEPYRRPIPRVLGGLMFSYGRGTPVDMHASVGPWQNLGWAHSLTTPGLTTGVPHSSENAPS